MEMKTLSEVEAKCLQTLLLSLQRLFGSWNIKSTWSSGNLKHSLPQIEHNTVLKTSFQLNNSTVLNQYKILNSTRSHIDIL